MKKQFNFSVKLIRTDNGGEYRGGKFRDYCRRNGIVQQFTTPESPFQNGVAERLNRTVVEGARAILAEKNLPKELWLAAMSYFLEIRNMMVKGENIVLNDIHAFGDKVFYSNFDKRKLDDKVKEGLYLGMDDESKGIRVLTEDRAVLIRRDYKWKKEPNEWTWENEETENIPKMDDIEILEKMPIKPKKHTELEDSEDEICGYTEDPFTPRKEIPREKCVFVYKCTTEDIPKTYQEAMKEKSRDIWQEAIKSELYSLMENNT